MIDVILKAQFKDNKRSSNNFSLQKRSTAMGITQAGGAIGVMALPQVLVLGVEYFGNWHSVVRLMAGGCLITCFSSLFMFPLKIAKNKDDEDIKDCLSPKVSLVPDRRISRAM